MDDRKWRRWVRGQPPRVRRWLNVSRALESIGQSGPFTPPLPPVPLSEFAAPRPDRLVIDEWKRERS